MLQDVVVNERPQLLVIGVEQLVVDRFGEHALFVRQPDQFVQFLQLEDRRLLDQQVRPRFEHGFGCGKVTVVRRRHAGKVDPLGKHVGDRGFAGKTAKIGDPPLRDRLTAIGVGRRPVRVATPESGTSTSPNCRDQSPSRCARSKKGR